MTLALEIAARVRAMRFEDLPDDALHWAKVGILDTVGVTIRGSRDEAARIVNKLTASRSAGASLAFGFDQRVSMLDAALINGTAAHALDFDDCSNTLGGHPSVPVLPALFAIADEMGATGRDFIAAYVAGFETECKISLGVNFYQYQKGWHPTSTIGIFGAAAAAGHLLNLTEDKIATALAIAASMAAGIKANFGTMTKPLHVGQCAHNGVMAALLAREGFSAKADAFEGKQGYLDLYNGAGNFDIARILAHWASPLDIVDPGLAIKQYPCCGSTNPAIDVMLALVQKHDLKPDGVSNVDIFIHARRLAHTNRPDPRSGTDAKFSVQYAVARALVDGKVIVDHFEGDQYRDPKVQAVLGRVRAAPYTAEQFPEDNHFAAEVRVTMTDGRIFSEKTDQALGRSPSKPLSAAMLKAKFENCVQGIIHTANIAPLYALIQALEKTGDVRKVTGLIAAQQVGMR